MFVVGSHLRLHLPYNGAYLQKIKGQGNCRDLQLFDEPTEKVVRCAGGRVVRLVLRESSSYNSMLDFKKKRSLVREGQIRQTIFSQSLNEEKHDNLLSHDKLYYHVDINTVFL